jgi:hypothetical protein
MKVKAIKNQSYQCLTKEPSSIFLIWAKWGAQKETDPCSQEMTQEFTGSATNRGTLGRLHNLLMAPFLHHQKSSTVKYVPAASQGTP